MTGHDNTVPNVHISKHDALCTINAVSYMTIFQKNKLIT